MLAADNSKEANALRNYENLETNNKDFTGVYPPYKPTDKGYPTPQNDFFWSKTEEPHTVRRRLILQKHPEINDLMGHCPRTKYWVLASVVAQFGLAYYLEDKMWGLQFWLIAYVIGATINHSLFLAIHEISHFLAFKSPVLNRYLGFFANLPIGIPYSTAFRGYHMEHHTQQGVDGIDTDLPTALEAKLFSSVPALRPMFIKLQKFTYWHAVNWIVQISAMAGLIYLRGPNQFYYLLTCTVLSGALHPMSGHFIAEHYIFVKNYETYSYYGPLNLLAYNVGFHNEHHDFPRIPGSRLPLVRKIAPEFYDNLPIVRSWPGTIFNFIFFPHISPFNRMKRKSKKD